MVEFGTGYQMPMDRSYGHSTPTDNSTSDVGVSMGDIGFSIGLGPVPNVQAVGAKLRAGSKTMEIAFMGAGKGSGQQQTPEYYGKKQREALLEMSKANQTDFTTHAAVGISGLAGMDQQGNFTKTNKSFALNEIKRAIEFAGDVAQGGPTVVHTGEFQRPLADADWNEKGPYKGRFKMYEDEAEQASFKVVDARSGNVIQEAKKNRKVARPIWKRYEKGDEYWDEYGGNEYKDAAGNEVKPGDYIDYEGNKLDPAMRAPKFDKDKGVFLVKQMEWNDLVEEAKDMTKRAKDDYNKWKSGQMSDEQFQKSIWRVRFLKEGISEKNIEVKPEEAYIIATLETNAANSRGWAYYYSGDFESHVDAIKKLKKAREFYKKMEEATDEDEKWKMKVQADSLAGGLVPTEAKFKSEIIDQAIKSREGHIAHAREGAASQFAQAEESYETMRHVESAESYAKKEAYDSYANAGIFAMEQSNKLSKVKKLDKPLSISMENLFPESYGAHPDEITNLVQGSRKRMINLLKSRGYSEEEAKKEAKDHINATIDAGHMNMWRKYWQGDKNSIEENDKDFNDWMIKKMDQMYQDGIIGHIHLTDNYGYQDDHLAPGEGNTPIKEIVENLKKKGYKGKIIVEPGADWSTDNSGFHSVMKTWRLFGSPVYGAAGSVPAGPRNWGQVQYGFFGQNQPPYFTFGGYSPSEEWTLWSGVPLE